MPHSLTHRAAPLSARLFALVVVPLLALGVLGVERIGEDRQAAADASELVEVVALQQAAAEVMPPAQLEWIALAGLATVDELGVPRNLIRAFTGLDFESIYLENQQQLDAALDRLVAEHGDAALPAGGTIGGRIQFLRGSLETQRSLSADNRADAADIDRIFDQIDEVLRSILAQHPGPTDTDDLDIRRVRLAALGNVITSGGEIVQASLDGLVDRSASDATDLRVATARHLTHVATFESLLPPDEAAIFAELTGNRMMPKLPVVERRDDGLLPPRVFQQAAGAIVEQLGYLDALSDYSAGFHERTADDVRREAAAAHADADAALAALLTIGLVTLSLVGLVAWSILSPVRRLTRRARDVSAGDLDHEPLPLRGPRDLRALTSTMNDMTGTLERVDDYIGRLAAGDTSFEGTDELPGAIGISFRNSVRHLVEVTSQLHRSEALASAIIRQADDAIWTVDQHGLIASANAASHRLTSVAVDDQIGRPIGDLISQTVGEAKVLTRPDTNVLVARSVIDAGDESLTAVIAHDISERTRFEEQLSYQARHDALTTLPNRFSVLEHLQELSDAHPGAVAVLYLDLDGFKSVNDVQGHAVGDRVLVGVAEKLQQSVRNGEFVGRLGGDEFVIITHRFGQVTDVIALAHRLVREVELPQDIDGKLFALSACVGVAVPPAGLDPLDMIGQADGAVYQAKRRGRGSVELFDRELKARIERTGDIEQGLRHAIANDELVLHLQPITDLRSGRVTGAEALVRWQRPGIGLVPPGDFIPIAERSSLILDVERWVMTRACEILVDWAGRDPDGGHWIAVNISGRHLVDSDLLSDVEAVLSLTGADPRRLTLELTETHLLEDMDRATGVLDALRSRGITIAVDDFGTGCSSMTYLRDLPVDVLKIDRSFIARSTEHGFDSTVVEAILTIARTLELHVIAEGVETEEQLEFVRRRNCDSAQGFLFARPMPVAQAEAVVFGVDALS